jgi:hypothetical protein
MLVSSPSMKEGEDRRSSAGVTFANAARRVKARATIEDLSGEVSLEQQIVEVRFQGEVVATHSDEGATYTLYRVPGEVYVVYVDKGEQEEAWLETGGSRGLEGQQVATFFPGLAAVSGLE